MINATRSSGTLRLRAGSTTDDARATTNGQPAQHRMVAGATGVSDGAPQGRAVDDRGANAQQPLESGALLRGRTHVNIVHNGETYQLRATRLGKLILTK